MRRFLVFFIIAGILASVISGCSGGNSVEDKSENITIIDGTGAYVDVDLPVEQIVSLNSGMSALICAFGDSDRLVGCNSLSVFPSSLLGKQIVGERAKDPNMELIAELEPDLVVSDTQLSDANRQRLESLGIDVLVEPTSDPDRIFFIIRNFGLILDKQEHAEDMIAYMESYLNIVYERIARMELEREEFPNVYFEYSDDFRSISAQSSMHKNIIAAGGLNIAAAEPFTMPKLSPEFILEKNPDIIIRRASRISDPEEMEPILTQVTETPGLKETEAVKNGDVYIFTSDIFLILNYPAGLAYFAKWIHHDEFQDIDPADIHKNLVEQFFGPEEWNSIADEIFVYPGD